MQWHTQPRRLALRRFWQEQESADCEDRSEKEDAPLHVRSIFFESSASVRPS